MKRLGWCGTIRNLSHPDLPFFLSSEGRYCTRSSSNYDNLYILCDVFPLLYHLDHHLFILEYCGGCACAVVLHCEWVSAAPMYLYSDLAPYPPLRARPSRLYPEVHDSIVLSSIRHDDDDDDDVGSIDVDDLGIRFRFLR